MYVQKLLSQVDVLLLTHCQMNLCALPISIYSPRALETARGSRIGREWASVGARVS